MGRKQQGQECWMIAAGLARQLARRRTKCSKSQDEPLPLKSSLLKHLSRTCILAIMTHWPLQPNQSKIYSTMCSRSVCLCWSAGLLGPVTQPNMEWINDVTMNRQCHDVRQLDGAKYGRVKVKEKMQLNTFPSTYIIPPLYKLPKELTTSNPTLKERIGHKNHRFAALEKRKRNFFTTKSKWKRITGVP